MVGPLRGAVCLPLLRWFAVVTKGTGCRQTATHQVEILEQVGSPECVLNVLGAEMGCGVGENSKSDFYT